MEIIAVATSYATIVGLLADFLNSRNATDISDFKEFMDWLLDHHKETYKAIEANQRTCISIKALLNFQHDQVIEKLAILDKQLAALSSNIEAIDSIAEVYYPDAVLSNQAISIVRQFYTSQAQSIQQMKLGYKLGDQYHLIGDSGNIEYTEPDYIEDDFDVLVSLGILKYDPTPKGDRRWKKTRIGEAFIKSITKNS